MAYKESDVAQSCPTLCDPMDQSLPGFSMHGISQARIPEYVAISFSRDWTWVSCIAGRRFTLWATREAVGIQPINNVIISRERQRDSAIYMHVSILSTVFPVVMYWYESWTIKKSEWQRIDAFELWCCGRLLTVPWTAKRSNQSILRKSALNIHWKDCCWSWSSNTLATWEVSILWPPDAKS